MNPDSLIDRIEVREGEHLHYIFPVRGGGCNLPAARDYAKRAKTRIRDMRPDADVRIVEVLKAEQPDEPTLEQQISAAVKTLNNLFAQAHKARLSLNVSADANIELRNADAPQFITVSLIKHL